MSYAKIVVDLDAEAVDQRYTYRVPAGMTLIPGQRVVVPFGRRVVEGVVASLTNDTDVPPEKLRDVLRLVDARPFILPELMALAREMQTTCHCTLAAALRLMIPAQLRGKHPVREKRVSVARLLVSGEALEAAKADRARAPKQLRVIEMLEDGAKPTPVLAQMVNGASAAIKALAERGIVAVDAEEVLRAPYGAIRPDTAREPVLTAAQARAVDRITAAMDGGGGRFLLLGVTGSGKTEVYIRAIRHALDAGRTAIVLVPEIALTPQMVDWFRARFGSLAAVLHSRLSPGERYDEWRRIRDGHAPVVVGARSAVFAPLEHLGVIVVDEEHDGAYQSDKRPAYDAREIARRRCEMDGAALVLASATPSVASYMKVLPGVKPQNRFELLELSERVNGRPMPRVEIVDMCREMEKGNHSIFSAALQEALTDCLANGHQAMLLMNRRGYSTFVSCRACGHVMKCEACDVSLTYHQQENLLRCHYCDATCPPPKTCPNCGSPYIKYFGAGTQKVEEAVAKRFPEARIARMDLDTTRGKDAHERILSAFRRGDTNVLIGTQMIAKGLDFPNVTLVGVVAADMSLNLPDYRSAERTFQLLTQVAGRAGRADEPGRVIVQTYAPEHYAVVLAARQDYRAFYQDESRYRRRGLYPPFTLLARVLVASADVNLARDTADNLAAELGAYLDEPGAKRRESVVQMRALEAPISRIRGKARYQVFIKLYARGLATDDILEEMNRLAQRDVAGATLDFEINPATMC